MLGQPNRPVLVRKGRCRSRKHAANNKNEWAEAFQHKHSAYIKTCWQIRKLLDQPNVIMVSID